MLFERGNKNVKASMSIGLRGIMKKAFDKKNLQFQEHLWAVMQNPANWSYEKRSWKKIPYYVIEVINVPRQDNLDSTKAWAHYIPDSVEPASLFYVEKDKVIEFARDRINRIDLRKLHEKYAISL